MHEVTVFCGERAIPAALEEDWRDRVPGGWTPLQAQGAWGPIRSGAQMRTWATSASTTAC